MAARGWRPAVAAAARHGRGGPGRGPRPGSGPAPELASEPGPEPAAPAAAALYVHWPYCRQRCSYCSFNKYVVPAVDEAAVSACLVQEARTLLCLSRVQRWVSRGISGGVGPFGSCPQHPHPLPYSVTSVFFGGGTPSLASPRTIAAVLEAVAGAAHLPAGTEVTLEANPSSTSTPCLTGFRAAGVNRLSIGVQGRAGAPGPGGWRRHWGSAMIMSPCTSSHWSGAQCWRHRSREGPYLHPPRTSWLTCTILPVTCWWPLASGTTRSPILRGSALPQGALSSHNFSYWRAEQYIGVGPGAHGRFVPWGEGGCSREARVQTLEPEAWMREVQSRGHGTRKRVALSPLEQLEEVLALGLRTDEGVTHKRWEHFSPHLSLEAAFGEPGQARDLEQQGWLVLDSRGLRCTWDGLAVLDSLLPDLLYQLRRRWALLAAPEAAPGRGGGAPRRSPTWDGAGGEAAGCGGLTEGTSGGSGE
ncbi:radical S-adenosyl methionine domain-containing protein 1, mitochondrial isoform 4-T4 [Porphyrio hochstetteri]